MTDYSVKLTEKQVTALRAFYWQQGVSQADLARTYGISPSQVCQIVHRKSWAFLTVVRNEPVLKWMRGNKHMATKIN